MSLTVRVLAVGLTGMALAGALVAPAQAVPAVPVLLSTAPMPQAASAAVLTADSGGIATTYQMNAAHNGYSPSGVAAPPLTRKWRRDLGGAVSYPVIADQKVFVTVRARDGYGTMLHALDVKTGTDAWKPIKLQHTYYWSALALGAGRLYALTASGDLTAYAIRTGKPIWAVKMPQQWSFDAAPTYRDGVVYVSGSGIGGTLYAVNAATGAITWSKPVINGDQSSPAVTADAVYVSYACAYTYRFATKTGALKWKTAPGCWGGGGRTAVVAAGSLWVRDHARRYPSTALRLTDGKPQGSFATTNDDTRAPAFLGRTGFFVSNGKLQARSVQNPNKSLWTFPDNRRITSAPIVVNGYVYAGSEDGHVYAVTPSTGRTVWSARVGAPILPPDEQNVSAPLTGLAAGQGILAVPASNLLVAYGK